MTLLLVDVSRWQAGLNLRAARDAGFQLVNVQLTGDAGYVFPNARARVDEARQLGMGVCVYHWLDGRLPGRVQAEQTWQRIQALGGPVGLAHQVDCEDTDTPATWTIWRDYVRSIQDKLGRPVVNYSADWWWDAPGRQWPGADITPYLWAAPNRGYPGSYPGDTSEDWRAGYGGWGDLAVMQYAVRDVAGVRCSLSAVRFHSLWNTLTGEGDAMAWRVARGLNTLLADINAIAPGRSTASDGSIGDPAHRDRPSDHNPDAEGVVRARDFTHDPGHGADMGEISEALRLSRDRRIKYVIFNRRIFSGPAGPSPWVWRLYTGTNPHDKHMHVSTVADNTIADDTSQWEVGMPTIEQIKAAVEDVVYGTLPKTANIDPGGATGLGTTWHTYQWARQVALELPGLRAGLQTLAEAQAADRDITPEELTAAVQAGVEQAADAFAAAAVPQLTAALIERLAPLLDGASEEDVRRIVAEVVAGVRLVPTSP